MTEIYDPAYPTGDDDDDNLCEEASNSGKLDIIGSKDMCATTSCESLNINDDCEQKTEMQNSSEEMCYISEKLSETPKSNNVENRFEVNGDGRKLSSNINCLLSSDKNHQSVTDSSLNNENNSNVSEQVDSPKINSDNLNSFINHDTSNDDLVSSETRHSSSISSQDKNDSTMLFNETQEITKVDVSTEKLNIQNDDNSNDNAAQNVWSSEAESSDSRCSGTSNNSNSQSEHKKKFGKFRILDSELLLPAGSDQVPKLEDKSSNNQAKNNSEVSSSDDNLDIKNSQEKCDVLSTQPLASTELTQNNTFQNSELQTQISEKEDTSYSSCEETAVRRSSRIRSIVEKREKEREEREKVEKNKKGKSDHKETASDKKKQEKQKEDKTQSEKKVKEESAKKTDAELNQKDKITPVQEKKERKSKSKANNTQRGKNNVKIVEQKSEEIEESKQSKPDLNISSPAQSQSSSPKYEGRKEQDDFQNPKPEKVKSRWRRSSELERGELSGSSTPTYIIETNERHSPVPLPVIPESQHNHEKLSGMETEVHTFPQYVQIEENIYLFERKRSKCKKEVRRMLCDCTLTKEEREKNIPGCGEDCLNRLLMIECGSRCATGDACTNKRFQKKEYVKTEHFKTARKGWGLRSLQELQQGTFVMEYVGEVLCPQEFKQRVKQYAREKTQHYYFMALKSDEIIDATYKGNLSRFINHSCDPNCETQKWTVNGELRIGFFTRRLIQTGEELTFDYQFQRYGKEAQKCFCESNNCRGYIGDDKQLELKPSQNRNLIPKRRKALDERKRELVEDLALEEEIEKLSAVGKLRNREQTLMLARLMVRAEDTDTRHRLLDIIENTTEQACLRLFLDYHGLSLLWSWMVDIGEDVIALKTQILRILTLLPITNKTMLLDSKVMNVVERWAKQLASQKLERGKDEIMENEQINPNTSQLEESEQPAKKLKLCESADITSDSESSNSPVNADVDNPYLSSDNRIASNIGSSEFNLLNPIESERCPSKEQQCTSNALIKEPLGSNSGYRQDNLELSGLKDDSEEGTKFMMGEKNSEMLGRADDESRDTIDDDDERREHGVASMAFKLLEVWNGLKEVFRIPRLEKQKRREDEQEVDRYEKEYSRNVRDQDQEWTHQEWIQPKDRHNSIKEKPYRCREFEKNPIDIESERKHMVDSPEWREERWHSKPNRKTNNELEETVIKPRKGPLLPTPPRLSKEERRHLFALEVQQRDEEALRRQQEQSSVVEYQQDTQFIYDTTTFPQYFQINPPYVQQIPNVPEPQLQVSTTTTSPSQTLIIPETTTEPPVTPLARTPLLPTPGFIDSQHQHQPLHQHQPHHQPQQHQHQHQHQHHCPQPPLPATPVSVPTSFPPEQPNAVVYPPSGIVYPPPATQLPYVPPPTAPLPAPAPAPAPTPVPAPAPAPAPAPIPVQAAPTIPPPSYLPPPPNQSRFIAQGQQLYYVQPPPTVPLPDPTIQQMPPPTSHPSVPIIHLAPSSSIIEESPYVPPSPPKPKPVKLPPNWKTAKDAEGNIYYYHAVTRQTQWDPPTADQIDEDMDLGTPTYDEPKQSKKKGTTTAAADTSSEVAKKIRELFRTKMSTFIVQCLNPYRKPDCKVGRIVSTEDFKHLARKLTHFVMAKELKHCKNVEDLECNENVKHKAKDFIHKYMAKFGSVYRKDD